MASDNKPRVLIVDNDNRYWDDLRQEFLLMRDSLSDGGFEPVFAETVRLAQQKLSDRTYAYPGVFVCVDMGPQTWPAVVRSVLQFRPNTPIFVLYGKTRPKLTEAEAQKLGIYGMISKPLTYRRVAEIFQLDADAAAEEASLPEAPEVDQAPPAPTAAAQPGLTDADVAEVDLTKVSGQHRSTFDLYVRLGNGKYVRILVAGDTLSPERIASYAAKGVTKLYIPRSAQSEVLKFYDSMIEQVLKDASVDIATKGTHVAAQGQSALQFVKNSGFSPESVKAAEQYVSNTTEVVKQLAAKNESAKKLMADIASYEHSMAVTTIASLMLKHIGAQNPVIFNAIGLACFFHDIALVGQPPELLLEEDETKMSDDQKKVFWEHPEESAKLVKKMKNVPPIVVTAIAQHHLKKNKGGFPKDKAVAEVNRIAEVIGISHDVLQLLKREKHDPKLDIVAALKVVVAQQYSEQIVDVFCRTFTEK